MPHTFVQTSTTEPLLLHQTAMLLLLSRCCNSCCPSFGRNTACVRMILPETASCTLILMTSPSELRTSHMNLPSGLQAGSRSSWPFNTSLHEALPV